MPVLVTDGDQRATLAVVRSLGRRGIPVVVGAERSGSLAASSRYASGEWVHPSPMTDPSGFQESLRVRLRANPSGILLPMTEVACLLLAEMAGDVPPSLRLALPDPEAFSLASDKGELLHLAERLGVPIPRTVFPGDVQQGVESARELTYPVVLKPRRSRVRMPEGWLQGSVQYAHSPTELADKLRAAPKGQPLPLVQERVVGPGAGAFALFSRGEPKALFAHRRLREKPPSGGVSVLRESVRIEGPLREHACRLLSALRWHGVAMVEFKIEEATGIPRLMEINPRFWGSLQLSIDAGVDFPYLLYRVLSGDDPPPVETYEEGVRTRWLLGDVDHLLQIWLKRRSSLSLPEGHPGRLGTLRDFLRSFGRDTRSEVWSREDPGPARRELSDYVGGLLHGARRRLG